MFAVRPCVEVLENRVAPAVSFGPAVSYPAVRDTVGQIAVADFNLDGHRDMLVPDNDPNADSLDAMSVLLGNGDGTFRPPLVLAAVNMPRCTVADFNNDGNPDVALISQGSWVRTPGGKSAVACVLLGNGDGTFGTPIYLDFQKGDSHYQTLDLITAADLNADGRPDLIMDTMFSNYLLVYLGNGDGTFGPPATLEIGEGWYSNPEDVIVADFNNDGRPDVVASTWVYWHAGDAYSRSDNVLSVFIGNGDGTFAPPQVYTLALGQATPSALVAGDSDGDGTLDLVAISYSYYYGIATRSDVTVLLGNGDGTFREGPSFSARASRYVTTGDFDGDGKPELLFSSYTAGYQTYSIFAGPPPAAARNICCGAAAAEDFNEDGRPDLAFPAWDWSSPSWARPNFYWGAVAVRLNTTGLSAAEPPAGAEGSATTADPAPTDALAGGTDPEASTTPTAEATPTATTTETETQALTDLFLLLAELLDSGAETPLCDYWGPDGLRLITASLADTLGQPVPPGLEGVLEPEGPLAPPEPDEALTLIDLLSRDVLWWAEYGWSYSVP